MLSTFGGEKKHYPVFLFKKKIEFNKEGIVSSEKSRNSGNYIYIYIYKSIQQCVNIQIRYTVKKK